MTKYLFHVYLEENNKWQHTLHLQRNELPSLLAQLTLFMKSISAVSLRGEARDLYLHLEEQEAIIDRITGKIKLQQDRLNTYREQDPATVSSFDAFFDQEELRDEVLQFEKKHLKFKQQFHQYLLQKP